MNAGLYVRAVQKILLISIPGRLFNACLWLFVPGFILCVVHSIGQDKRVDPGSFLCLGLWIANAYIIPSAFSAPQGGRYSMPALPFVYALSMYFAFHVVVGGLAWVKRLQSDPR